LIELRDRAEILAALSAEDRYLHLYQIGDLDPFFFPHTRWFAPDVGAPPLALLYTGTELPVLLALTTHAAALAPLLSELPLPDRLYAHLSPGLALDGYLAEPHGRHVKMALRERRLGDDLGVALGPSDRDRLVRFFDEAYPGNWFDPRMLETGVYRAIIEDGAIVAAGGIHVYSKEFDAAALGNIAVHREHRGRGFGARITASVCHALADIAHVGLNVKADNVAAIRCYERLGFVENAVYDEYMLRRR
jgi:RimJ/RimL family protein N-acetyltransferase